MGISGDPCPFTLCTCGFRSMFSFLLLSRLCPFTNSLPFSSTACFGEGALMNPFNRSHWSILDLTLSSTYLPLSMSCCRCTISSSSSSFKELSICQILFIFLARTEMSSYWRVVDWLVEMLDIVILDFGSFIERRCKIVEISEVILHSEGEFRVWERGRFVESLIFRIFRAFRVFSTFRLSCLGDLERSLLYSRCRRREEP